MSNDHQIKIAIADDHKIFRDGIKMALSGKTNLKMLWEAEDGKDMMHKIAIKKPEVLLMDIRMPEIDGMVGFRRIGCAGIGDFIPIKLGGWCFRNFASA